MRSTAIAAKSLGAVALVLVGACGAEAGAPVGVSPFRTVMDATTPRGIDAGAPVLASPVAADFRSHMARVSERGVSCGHAERFDAVVWANDGAQGAWNGSGDMPDGAILVEEAIERTVRGDRPAGLLVMEKHGETWRFVLVEADGHVVPGAQAAACASCHADAPRDFVFRIDRATSARP
jgi:hypothetical protein